MVERAPEAGDFLALTRKISVERGFGCASYKEKCLQRRIAVRMRARGVNTYGEYSRVLDTDATEYDRLLDALTINVTKLFRNWDTYRSLAANVVPSLWSAALPTIRVWSAGCSSGHEPYSLAVLFHRHAEQLKELSRLARVDVLGTDIDRRSLLAARHGQFGEPDFADTPADLRTKYFSAVAPFTVSAAVRSMVRFENRDLIGDAPPRGPFHLIACRNVLIYFDRDTQTRLFDVFHDALAPGGFLLLGKVETILGPSRARFAAVDARERIFRRK
jgi:chemotaxis methyl-accepting protein methylase